MYKDSENVGPTSIISNFALNMFSIRGIIYSSDTKLKMD